MKDFLHSNFIGFLTEKESIVIFRNIDNSSNFRYFKQFLKQTLFLDYYKLYGGDYNSNNIVISEGIFDIFNEQIFDYTGLKNRVKLYAAALSTSFESLIKSIVYDEQLFKINVNVLADNGVEEIPVKEGNKFDPAIHEAVENSDKGHGTSDKIKKILLKGYKLNGKVLRAARVIVE
jgi:hypothetical protein